MFQGDIAQFAPADLLLFLSHMNKEGVLTVRQDDTALNLSFRRNLLVDAVSEPSERLILDRLAQSGALSEEALRHLRQAHEETGLPVVRILENAEWLGHEAVGEAMLAGLRETVFRLLLWERGSFQFTEIPVEDNPCFAPVDGQALVMDVTREVDEYRELVRGLGPLERRAFATAAPDGISREEGWVLARAGEAASVGELLESAPYRLLNTTWAVATAIDRGWLELAAGEPEATPAAPAGVTPDALAAYRQALRRMLQTDERQRRIRELLAYAQAHCVQSILLVVGGGRLERATVYGRDPGGRLVAHDHRDPPVELGVDMVFQQALASGRPFVGSMFPSPILEALDATAPATECALLPLGRLGRYDLLLHAAADQPGGTTGPVACLELLSWQIRPPQVEAEPVAADEGPAAPADGDHADARDDEAAAELVASIKDLPPMPQVAARALNLLADADCDMARLTEVLSQDPALVARLVKVSNSSLYGGHQDTGSLDQAIVRLGTRTTRSVVVAASTRSLFPLDKTRVGLLGRELWQHAVRTGLAARRVAEFTRRADADEAFTAGVLHDLGKVIILLDRPDEYAEIHRRLEAGVGDSVYAEREQLGFDHCLVGERLLEGWGMPASLCAVARWHHEPEGAGDHAPLVQVVACGDLLAHELAAAGSADERLVRRLEQVAGDLGLDERARADLGELLALDLEQGDLLD